MSKTETYNRGPGAMAEVEIMYLRFFLVELVCHVMCLYEGDRALLE